jgi:two-component system sensor histidine kinase PhoQ
MTSLRARVALAAGVVLASFVVLTSVALEQAFRDSARSAREERLLGQLYLLMAAAESEDGGALSFPEAPPEPRLSLPGSGLYGQVTDDRGQVVWRSASALGVAPPFPASRSPGERRFETARDGAGRAYFVESFGVNWATGSAPRLYTFSVAEDLTEFEAQLARFRTSLAGWLGGMSLLLLAALGLALHWGLGPLRRVAEELRSVEAGRQERIEGDYPTELKALTDNLNALLVQERARQARLANAMGDLAHSLKTPLAVVRGAISEPGTDRALAAALEEQVARMDKVVAHHLQRASAGTVSRLAAALPVRPLAEKLVATLAKVHRDKKVQASLDMAEGVAFRGVEGDLMEILGNLLDNAWKWCRGRVRVSARRGADSFTLVVEDDGPGMDTAEAQRLLERGVRADESVPGHGIGLATVRDIAAAYGAEIAIERSGLGGALIRLRFPA